MLELILRFIIGGAVVSLFAMLGDLLRPRSFAGLFGAAPSIALATLVLTIHSNGRTYAAREGETMILGAAAFLVYASLASGLLRKKECGALLTTVVLIPVWFAVSLGLYGLLSGRL